MFNNMRQITLVKIEHGVKHQWRKNRVVSIREFARMCDISSSTAHRFYKQIAGMQFSDEQYTIRHGVLLCNKTVRVRAMESHGVGYIAIDQLRVS